jgi:hypothetical protein
MKAMPPPSRRCAASHLPPLLRNGGGKNRRGSSASLSSPIREANGPPSPRLRRVDVQVLRSCAAAKEEGRCQRESFTSADGGGRAGDKLDLIKFVHRRARANLGENLDWSLLEFAAAGLLPSALPLKGVSNPSSRDGRSHLKTCSSFELRQKQKNRHGPPSLKLWRVRSALKSVEALAKMDRVARSAAKRIPATHHLPRSR